jgi:hypothetical protein
MVERTSQPTNSYERRAGTFPPEAHQRRVRAAGFHASEAFQHHRPRQPPPAQFRERAYGLELAHTVRRVHPADAVRAEASFGCDGDEVQVLVVAGRLHERPVPLPGVHRIEQGEAEQAPVFDFSHASDALGIVGDQGVPETPRDIADVQVASVVCMVYALREGVAATLLAANEDFEPALKLLFNENSYALVNSFGSTPEGLGVPQSILEPERAVITLATYTLVFFLIQAPLLRRRDVA